MNETLQTPPRSTAPPNLEAVLDDAFDNLIHTLILRRLVRCYILRHGIAAS